MFVVSVHYLYLGVPYSQFWAPKHNLGMVYTGSSTTFKKRAIARSRPKNVPCVCTYIKFFQEVRQLCMKYTQHKYLIDWTIRKKDTLFQSQKNLGGELWTLSLILKQIIKIIFHCILDKKIDSQNFLDYCKQNHQNCVL